MRMPDVLFSEQELAELQAIDAQPSARRRSDVRELEMRCQRDMTVRGRRLWAYHAKLGDLAEIFPELAPPMPAEAA